MTAGVRDAGAHRFLTLLHHHPLPVSTLPPVFPLYPQRSSGVDPLHGIASAGPCTRQLPTVMGRKRPTVPPPPIMDHPGLDCGSRPAGLDSCVTPRPGLSPHEKATLAIDAIDNKLPDRNTLPFFFFFFF